MITNNEIAKGIENLLSSYNDLSNTTIERGVNINFDVERMPWVGVYPGNFEVNPATLGANQRRWRRTMHPVLILQEQSFDNEGQEAADRLDVLIERTLMAISSEHNQNLAFGITGARLVGINAVYMYEPANIDEEGENYFPQCELTLDIEVRE